MLDELLFGERKFLTNMQVGDDERVLYAVYVATVSARRASRKKGVLGTLHSSRRCCLFCVRLLLLLLLCIIVFAYLSLSATGCYVRTPTGGQN